MSSPGHRCITRSAYFSSVVSRQFLRVLSSSDVPEMHSEKASLSNFLTAHPVDLARGASFRLLNLKQTYRWSLSEFSSNTVQSRRCFLSVGWRNVRSNTDDDALLWNVAIPGWLRSIRSSETIISSKSWPLLSSVPPLHDLDLALKSPATMMGPSHCLVLPSSRATYPPAYLATSLPTCLPACLPACLPSHLSTCWSSEWKSGFSTSNIHATIMENSWNKLFYT